MADVPIAADHRIPPTGGQDGHPRAHGGHEALLLLLTSGARLTGGQIDARDGQVADLGLQVPARLIEFATVGVQGHPGGGRRNAAQNPYAAASLHAGGGTHHLPPGGQGWGQRLPQLVLLGAHLLQTHDVGARLLQPGQQSPILRGPLLDGRTNAIDVDGGDGDLLGAHRSPTIVERPDSDEPLGRRTTSTAE
ncbi:Uncharacterised protein [Mycobacteroides abscessus subsp. abscessus]|nr:Uncharacterised protein [Mycobacteroides abscessus subsp. abscessus]